MNRDFKKVTGQRINESGFNHRPIHGVQGRLFRWSVATARRLEGFTTVHCPQLFYWYLQKGFVGYYISVHRVISEIEKNTESLISLELSADNKMDIA
jgi:hypothetical protein